MQFHKIDPNTRVLILLEYQSHCQENQLDKPCGQVRIKIEC